MYAAFSPQLLRADDGSCISLFQRRSWDTQACRSGCNCVWCGCCERSCRRERSDLLQDLVVDSSPYFPARTFRGLYLLFDLGSSCLGRVALEGDTLTDDRISSDWPLAVYIVVHTVLSLRTGHDCQTSPAPELLDG